MTDPLSIVKVSIVTVCMNRRAHLLVSADNVSRWPHHQEHLILDWSSDQPLTRADLPADSRIRLVRVDGERQWHLCRAYNLALRLARGDRLFKLDADCWPEAMPSPEQLAAAGPVAAFCSGPDGRAGQWLLERRFVDQVGGFNEVLLGYGFDDKDFRARVEAQGVVVQRLPASALGVIAHSASLRVSRSGEVSSPTAMQRVSAQSLKRATAITNRLLAAGHPWSAKRLSSEYDTDPTNGALRVQRPTIPRPSLQLDDEAQRLRRRIYWGLFFSLPEELVVRMPVRLLPNDLRGRFLLKPIHRWSWYLIRPLWAWPLLVVQALQRPSQSARAEQAVWLALEMVDWPALLDALQRLRRRQRRDLIERLLFQRGLRPKDNTQQKELFSSLLNADVLDPDQRLYAGIALGWSLIRIADSKAATSLIDQLMLEASRLEVDPSTQKCQRRNRDNRLKRLVSTWTVVLHLALLCGRDELMAEITVASHRLLQRTDLNRVPADVLLRMSSNWARCLVWQWPASRDDLKADLDALNWAMHQARIGISRPDEDHRRFVNDLQNLMNGSSGRPVLEHSLGLKTPELLKAIDRF